MFIKTLSSLTTFCVIVPLVRRSIRLKISPKKRLSSLSRIFKNSLHLSQTVLTNFPLINHNVLLNLEILQRRVNTHLRFDNFDLTI